MEELLGKEIEQAQIVAGGYEGRILFYEKGLMYDCQNVNGKVYSLYTSVMKIEPGDDLPLGKKELRLVLMTPLGEKFDLKMAINDHFIHVLRDRCGR